MVYFQIEFQALQLPKNGTFSRFVVSMLNVAPHLGTNISPFKGTFEDDVPSPKVGYVSSLEDNSPSPHFA